MKIKSILIGVLAGITLTFWPATILVFGLLLVSLLGIKICTGAESRKFLIGIFLTGFILRVIFSFLYATTSHVTIVEK